MVCLLKYFLMDAFALSILFISWKQLSIMTLLLVRWPFLLSLFFFLFSFQICMLFLIDLMSEQNPTQYMLRILIIPWYYIGYHSNINFTQYNAEEIKDLLDLSASNPINLHLLQPISHLIIRIFILFITLSLGLWTWVD